MLANFDKWTLPKVCRDIRLPIINISFRFEEEQRHEEYLMGERERNMKKYKQKAAAKADMLAKIK